MYRLTQKGWHVCLSFELENVVISTNIVIKFHIKHPTNVQNLKNVSNSLFVGVAVCEADYIT